MKKVLSVSLGSSARDHTVETDFLGEKFWISRQGTDGDFERYLDMYRQYDGQVDAFGVGGVEFYLQIADRRYYWRDVKRVREIVQVSKIGDGNGFKHVVAPYTLQALREHGVDLTGKKVLQTTAADRYGMAQALIEAGCDMTFGDLMFALDVPIPLYTLRSIRILGSLLMPILTRLPFSWVYPVGDSQSKQPSDKYSRFYEPADIITGDFLQIWSNLPADLSGKIIITNTTTTRDLEELHKRNLHMLVTTTPRLNGRSFGTNVMEAVCRCLVDKPDHQITPKDIVDLIDRIPLKPQVQVLN